MSVDRDNARLRVLHLVPTKVDHGGVLSVIRGIAEDDARRGGAEHVLWVNDRFVQEREPKLELRYTSASSDGGVGQILRGVRDLLGLLRRERFDVLHAHDRFDFYCGLVVCLIRMRALLVSLHFYSSRPWFFRNAIRLPWVHSCWLTPNMLKHYGIDIRPRRYLVPDCCGETFFTEPLGAGGAGGSPGKVQLKGFGMLIEWKGWHVLLEALGRLDEHDRGRIELEIVGKASQTEAGRAYEKGLHEQIERLGLEEIVRFRGFIPDVKASLRSADWIVLPSVNEPCSVALSEALAYGKPVVVTRSGGNIDTVVEGKSGLFFEPGNDEELAGLLRRILAGEKLEWGPQEIRESAQVRSASHVAKLLGDVYRRVAKRPVTSE